MNNLELVPTQALIDELLKRHRFAIFAGVSHDDDPDWQSKGDLSEIIGFWEIVVKPDLIETFRTPCEQCEGGEGHGDEDNGE